MERYKKVSKVTIFATGVVHFNINTGPSQCIELYQEHEKQQEK